MWCACSIRMFSKFKLGWSKADNMVRKFIHWSGVYSMYTECTNMLSWFKVIGSLLFRGLKSVLRSCSVLKPVDFSLQAFGPWVWQFHLQKFQQIPLKIERERGTNTRLTWCWWPISKAKSKRVKHWWASATRLSQSTVSKLLADQFPRVAIIGQFT